MSHVGTLGPKNATSYLARARACWSPMPAWVAALASRLDVEVARGGNQGTIAKLLGLPNASVISALIGNKYAGRIDRLQARIEGALMSATVDCPALAASIGRDACAAYQRRKFSAANPQLVKLHKTCPGCVHFMGAK